LRRAVFLRRADIIAAQVGAEKSRTALTKLTDDANAHCDIIDRSEFWKLLDTVLEDLAPICYGTNINQSDRVRPDQVLLTFAGMYLHFRNHKNAALGRKMVGRIEKRWKALDQDLFVLALILNPYEGLDRFGDKAGCNPFTLTSFLLLVRVKASKNGHRSSFMPSGSPSCQITAFWQ
jgi:hypothetical protein